jgi:hypothetical protein
MPAQIICGSGLPARKAVTRQQPRQGDRPETAANLPPTPYYTRGEGMQYKTTIRRTSENLGDNWVVSQQHGGYYTKIGNRVSYAKYVHGDQQAHWMKRIGWKKLKDVADDKMPRIRVIYQKWINRAIKKAGL